jgi:hypothetical protein
MNTRDARKLVYELLALFFAGADVVYAKQSNTVKPAAPLVALNTVSVKRPQNPPMKIIDGVPVSYYPTVMSMQIDLYTLGSPVEAAPGCIVPMENTAVNDLAQFANFAGSEYAANWSQAHDVALAVNGEVMDTTGMVNGTGYEFRATLEITLGFTEGAVGYSGILSPSSIKPGTGGESPGNPADPGGANPPGGEHIEPEFTPSPSGGGTEELAKEEIGYFTEAEIEAKKEET